MFVNESLNNKMDSNLQKKNESEEMDSKMVSHFLLVV